MKILRTLYEYPNRKCVEVLDDDGLYKIMVLYKK